MPDDGGSGVMAGYGGECRLRVEYADTLRAGGREL